MHLFKAKKFSQSSQRWLRRQLKDPYVKKALTRGVRSRAAFKLEEIHQKYNLFQKGQVVVDLGAAPGGWSCVVAPLVQNAASPKGCVIAVDLLEMEAIQGVTFLQGDLMADTTQKALLDVVSAHGGVIDGVISDMAPSLTGHAATDHLRQMHLTGEALAFATKHLSKGGFFVVKIFQGSQEAAFLKSLRAAFKRVYTMKPDASRPKSREMYAVCCDFLG